MLDPALTRRLREAGHIAVFTGAGISAESGIPTFRDRCEGLWAQVDPMEVATPWAFRENPQRVWDWHVHLVEAMRRARPNAGHRAIARLQDVLGRVSVITQNIDNLHQDAGSRGVIELHGNIHRLKAFVDEEAAFADGRSPVICPVCDGYAVHEDCDPFAAKEDLLAIRLQAGPVPRCPCCGALLRPDIVWFGEPLDPEVFDRAWDAADTCDALICVGSSLVVEPAASLPYRALARNALVIEVNPQPTQLSDLAQAYLPGPAAVILPQLVEAVWGISPSAEKP